MQAIFETLFDIAYLAAVLALGCGMIRGSRGEKQYLLYGIMAVVLGCGDAFHLIPRAVALCTTGLESYSAALGVGKLVTSITMTVFYLLLYYVWRTRYRITGGAGLTATVWALSLSRILLCLAPQNRWTSAEAPLSWAVWRNIPFALLGLLIALLFYRRAGREGDRPFRFMWLAVLLSFAFYIPVVLFADALPPVGMLMIPKTCVYVWMVMMGRRAMKGES